MSDIVRFLRLNDLKQKQLAQFLGVTETTISKLAKEQLRLSPTMKDKILNNEMGWDTSMLTESPIIQNSGDNAEINVHSKNRCSHQDNTELNVVKRENEYLLEKIAMLETQLEKAEALAERYWNMIESKMK